MTKKLAIDARLFPLLERRLAFSAAPELAVAVYCAQERRWVKTRWLGPVPLSQRMSPMALSSSEIQRASLAKYRNRKSSNLRGRGNVADPNSRWAPLPPRRAHCSSGNDLSRDAGRLAGRGPIVQRPNGAPPGIGKKSS